MMKKISRVCCFILIIGLVNQAQAQLASGHGISARSLSLAGSNLLEPTPSFAAFENPSAMINTATSQNSQSESPWLTENHHVYAGMGSSFSDAVFRPLGSIVTANSAVSDASSTEYSDYAVEDIKPVWLTHLGVTYQYKNRFALGLASAVPVQRMAYVDSGPAYLPQYPLFRSQNQRPFFCLGAALSPSQGLSFGVSTQMAFDLSSTGDAFLQGNTSKYSSMRFSSQMKMKLRPMMGFKWQIRSQQQSHPLAVGILWKAKAKSENTILLRTNAQVLNPLPSLPINVRAENILFYDPLTVSTSVVWDPTAALRTYLSLDFENWSKRPPTAVSLTPEYGLALGTALPVSASVRNIWVPRIGAQWSVHDRLQIRGGYTYRPSIYRGVPSGNGNELDPTQHILALGGSYDFGSFAGIPSLLVDLGASYHFMVPEKVSKAPGNEMGEGATPTRLGSPGYTSRGYGYELASTVSVSL